MTDAFDADVLIYAGQPGHLLGRRVLATIPRPVGGEPTGDAVGSVLLLAEVLSKPIAVGAADEVNALSALLGRLDLRVVDREIAVMATTLRGTHGLKTVDAVHLATAVMAGADRFITNNRRDFTGPIEEIDVVFADELPDPDA